MEQENIRIHTKDGVKEFDTNEEFLDWNKKMNEKHRVEWLMQNLVKNGHHLTEDEVDVFYKGFVQEQMIDHYPEDSETLKVIIDTYNYLNK